MRRTIVLIAESLTAALLVFYCVSCSKDDDPTGPSAPTICFTVSGFNVGVNNMWKNGSVHSENVQGLASFSESASQGSESHTLVWTNIRNDYTSYTVTSFNVKIDGVDYSYPANKCK